MDKLINRVRAMMAFATETEIAIRLDDDGVDRGDAFLAIKAAAILEGN